MIYTFKPKYIQTPLTFLTLSQFIRYSLVNCNKIWQELRVKLWQNKFILIMSDNFDNELQSTKNSDNCWYDNINTTTNSLLTNYQAMLNFVQILV